MKWDTTPLLIKRVNEISDALGVAYIGEEIENIRLVITVREAADFKRHIDMDRGFAESVERPIPDPVPGRFWVKLYGVDVWIKESR